MDKVADCVADGTGCHHHCLLWHRPDEAAQRTRLFRPIRHQLEKKMSKSCFKEGSIFWPPDQRLPTEIRPDALLLQQAAPIQSEGPLQDKLQRHQGVRPSYLLQELVLLVWNGNDDEVRFTNGNHRHQHHCANHICVAGQVWETKDVKRRNNEHICQNHVLAVFQHRSSWSVDQHERQHRWFWDKFICLSDIEWKLLWFLTGMVQEHWRIFVFHPAGKHDKPSSFETRGPIHFNFQTVLGQRMPMQSSKGRYGLGAHQEGVVVWLGETVHWSSDQSFLCLCAVFYVAVGHPDLL